MIKKIIFAFVFIFSFSMLFALGNKEKEPPVAVVQATGVVRLTGSALFTELVISGAEQSWYIAKEDAGKLHDLQQRIVTVEAEETVREMFFANGMSAGIRRELRNIKVMKVE